MRFDTKPYTGYIFMVAGLRSDAERVAVEDDIVFVRVIKVPMHTEPHWPKPLKPVMNTRKVLVRLLFFAMVITLGIFYVRIERLEDRVTRNSLEIYWISSETMPSHSDMQIMVPTDSASIHFEKWKEDQTIKR
jgi:hypothetical protein